MKILAHHFTIVALTLLCSGSVPAGETWPEFRGPNGLGRADNADLPITIDQSVVKWETAIDGKGWSSPVVWENEIWLTTAKEDGTEMSLLCVDRPSGKILHNKVLLRNEDPAFCHPTNSYASPTPIVTQSHVIVHFGSYLTACLDRSTLQTVWKRDDLECDHHRGPASSPILHDGKIFVAFDGVDVQYVVALDATSGKTVWRRKREIDYGSDNGDLMKGYGTASIIVVGGEEQLVYPSAVATIAYRPQDGETLWTAYHDGMNASARPMYLPPSDQDKGGLVIITNGMGSMVAVDPSGSGDVTDTHLKWATRKGVAKKSSQLLIDGVLYMNSDDGIMTARDASTGKIYWQERAGGGFAASPVYASGRIYAFGLDGETLTFKAGKDYKLLAEATLGDGFMASPAVVGDDLILRSKSKLYRIAK